MSSTLWPHQERGIRDVVEALHHHDRVLLTSPTGMGKSRMACELIHAACGWGWHCVLYSNRRLLIDQLGRTLARAGIDYGVRAAGASGGEHWPVQISSLPTERVRTIEREIWGVHGAGHKCLALIDEAHLNNNDTAHEMINRHLALGHKVLGITATPLDLAGTYDVLVQAGTVAEGRGRGALVPARHFGCDEPDLSKIGKREWREGEDLSARQNAKAIMVPGIFGRVRDWYERLNPDRHPAILFGPDVAGSIWFAEQFTKSGHRAAHIDGKDIWLDGKLLPSDQQTRDQVLDMVRDGSIKVICNRFVLREGIDLPELRHGIFATVVGSLQSYLQMGGRLLRACEGKDDCVIQDHGGNWHRHGSLNADRHWRLEYTGAMLAGLRADRLREKKDVEPVTCPKCRQVLTRRQCPCGYVVDMSKKSRLVYEASGQLKEYIGDIYRPRKTATNPSLIDVWVRQYYRSRKAGRTFRQAEALFARENNYQWPDRSWPFMPKNPEDFFQKVNEVPRENLIPQPGVNV